MKAKPKPPLNLVSDRATLTSPPVDPIEIDALGSVERAPAPSPTASDGSGFWVWFWSGAAALLWIVGLAGFAVGFEGARGAFAYEPFRVAVFALLALAPLGLLFALAYALAQAARLRSETARARSYTDDLIGPTLQSAIGVADVVRELQVETAAAGLAAERARRDLTALREALAQESARLAEASETALKTAERLQHAFGREREAFVELGAKLDAQIDAAAATVERQTRLVSDASDLAGAQLREAEAALAVRTADLAAAAGEAQDATLRAAEELSRQTLKLESAGTGVAEQVRAVEDGLSQQRAALVAAAVSLRADQEDFSVQSETQRARLAETLDGARIASDQLTETSARGAETLRTLVEQATTEIRRFSEQSGQEQAEFEARTRESLTRFGRLAAETRDALQEETAQALEGLAEAARRAAGEAAEAAQSHADRLGEAVFDAGRRADAAFDARIEDAKRLVEQSAAMLDEAGARATARLHADLEALRSTLAGLEAGLADIDERARRLPEETRERVEAVKVAVESGLTLLADAARRAAAETSAVDLAFQERVKRNYDMLSEAVSLMGVIAGDRTTPAPPPPPRKAKSSEPQVPEPDAPLLLDDEAIATRRVPPKADASAAGLRGRLKLTPTATDEEFRTVFGQASGKSRPAKPQQDPDGREPGGWSWKELLGGMDESGALAPSDAAARLIDEIQALGVDSAALLPRARVEEAAQAITAGDPEGARRIVRRVAPAAVRRLSRRILGDRALRAQADGFVGDFASRLKGAPDPIAVLGVEEGRAFLLIDAAIGDAL